MSDQELLDKTVEVHKRLAYARRFSVDAHLLSQLQEMADACAFTHEERQHQHLYDTLYGRLPEESELTGEIKATVAKTNGANRRTSSTRESSLRTVRSTRPIKD